MRHLRPRLAIITYFIVANLLGLTAASTILSQQTVVEMGASGSLSLMLAIPVVGVIMLLLYKYRVQLLIKIWMLSALFFTSLLFYSAFLALPSSLACSLITLILYRFSQNWKLKNACLVASFAGAGALFGIMLDLFFASLFLIFLSIYDLIAVFYTKQMISLVQQGMSTDTFLGFQYPKGNQASLEKVKATKEEETVANGKETTADKRTPGILGGGDVIIPLLFSVAVFKAYGWIASLLTVAFAALGLSLLFFKSREGKFYPAIPAVAGGCFSGLGLWLLIAGLIA